MDFPFQQGYPSPQGYQPQAQPQMQGSAPSQNGNLMDVLNQMSANQQPANSYAQQIFSQRFQPTMNDVGQAGLQTAMSFGSPNFKPETPQDVAQTRVSNELAPYTTMLDLGIKARQGMPDFTKMAQYAFLKQASGAPMTPQDTAAVDAWRNMGQNGIMFDPSTGNMIQTNTRMPGGMAGTPAAGPPGFGQGGSPNTNPSPQTSLQPPMNYASPNTGTTSPNTPPGLTPKAGAAFLNKRAEDLAGAADASATASATVQSLDKAIDQALAVNDKIPGGATQGIGNILGQNVPAFSDINQNSVLYNQAVGNNILAGLQTLKGLGRLDIPEVNQIIKTYGIGIENSPQGRAAGLEALRQYIHNNAGTAQNIYSNMSAPASTQQAPIQPISNNQQQNGIPQGAQQGSDGRFYLPDPQRPGKYLRIDQ